MLLADPGHRAAGLLGVPAVLPAQPGRRSLEDGQDSAERATSPQARGQGCGRPPTSCSSTPTGHAASLPPRDPAPLSTGLSMPVCSTAAMSTLNTFKKLPEQGALAPSNPRKLRKFDKEQRCLVGHDLALCGDVITSPQTLCTWTTDGVTSPAGKVMVRAHLLDGGPGGVAGPSEPSQMDWHEPHGIKDREEMQATRPPEKRAWPRWHGAGTGWLAQRCQTAVPNSEVILATEPKKQLTARTVCGAAGMTHSSPSNTDGRGLRYSDAFYTPSILSAQRRDSGDLSLAWVTTR